MPIEITTVNALLRQEFPATESLLANGLIDKAGAILISGPQKIGKSLFGTQLAFSLAARAPFLGFEIGDAHYRTLILQAEVAPKRMKQRFVKQVTGFAPQTQEHVLTGSVFSSVKLDSTEGEKAVMGWVAEYRPDLLIVDPLSNFHRGDENEAQAMTRITTVLDGIREKGVAVALVHHHGKSSSERQNVGHKARGSSVLPGWYDSHFSLEWATFGQTVRLRFELRHDETPEDKILKLNPETLLFEVQNDEASQVALVVAAVRELGPTPAEPVGQRCGKSREWARQWLERGVEEGKLVRMGSRPVRFSLPEDQPATTTVEIPTAHGDRVVVSTNTRQGLQTDPPEGGNWLWQSQ